MREVPPLQTFGLRGVARDVLGVDECVVGVKCGWFGGERAHAVVMAGSEGSSLGAVVTTDRLPEAGTSALVREAVGDDMKLAIVHDRLVGDNIRTAARRSLQAAHEL